MLGVGFMNPTNSTYFPKLTLMLTLKDIVIGSQWDIDFSLRATRLNLLLGKLTLNSSHILPNLALCSKAFQWFKCTYSGFDWPTYSNKTHTNCIN